MISATTKMRIVTGRYSAVLYAAVVVMELCWLSVLLMLVNGMTGHDIFIPWVLLIYLISFGFNLLIMSLTWPKVAVTAINWLAWLPVMLINVKLQVFGEAAWADPGWLSALLSSIPISIYGLEPGLLLLLYSLLMWWLAKWLAFRRANFNTSVMEFQFGLVMLIAVSAIAGAIGTDLQYVAPVAAVFFTCGLIGISLAHMLEGKNWSGGLSKSQWSLLVIISTGLILAVGMAIAFIVSPDFLKAIVDAVGWVFMQIMYLLSLLASLFPTGDAPAVLPATANMTSNSTEMKDIFHIPEDVRLWMNVIWATVFLGFLVVAVWQISAQLIAWIRKRSLARGGSVEPLKGAFKADILALLNWIERKIGGLFSFLRKMDKSGMSKGEASVHTLYRHLLKWGARKGYPRDAAQTPNEYLDKVMAALPQAAGDLSLITECFVRTYYGKASPTRTELREINESWKRIRQNRYTRQGRQPA